MKPHFLTPGSGLLPQGFGSEGARGPTQSTTRIRLALPCCCSCRQAMATELKKQKPLGGGKRGPDSPFLPVPPPLQPPLSTRTWPGPAPEGSSNAGLPRALHGCGMVCMVSWGPNHSKTVLEMERMLINQMASPLTPSPSTCPQPQAPLQSQDGPEVPSLSP